MSKEIGLMDLPEELNNMFEEYSKEVIDQVDKITKSSGFVARSYVKDNAPVLTGDYKSKIATKYKKKSMDIMQSVVYVKAPEYRLAHLLEKPHALRNGGRSKALPHFKPALDKVTPEYIRKIKEAIEELA